MPHPRILVSVDIAQRGRFFKARGEMDRQYSPIGQVPSARI